MQTTQSHAHSSWSQIEGWSWIRSDKALAEFILYFLLSILYSLFWARMRMRTKTKTKTKISLRMRMNWEGKKTRVGPKLYRKLLQECQVVAISPHFIGYQLRTNNHETMQNSSSLSLSVLCFVVYLKEFLLFNAKKRLSIIRYSFEWTVSSLKLNEKKRRGSKTRKFNGRKVFLF